MRQQLAPHRVALYKEYGLYRAVGAHVLKDAAFREREEKLSETMAQCSEQLDSVLPFVCLVAPSGTGKTQYGTTCFRLYLPQGGSDNDQMIYRCYKTAMSLYR